MSSDGLTSEERAEIDAQNATRPPGFADYAAAVTAGQPFEVPNRWPAEAFPAGLAKPEALGLPPHVYPATITLDHVSGYAERFEYTRRHYMGPNLYVIYKRPGTGSVIVIHVPQPQ